MRAGGRQTRLPLSVVAVVAHVFGVVPHVLMVANEKLTHPLGILLDFLQAFMTILQVEGLQLKGAHRILIEELDVGARDLSRLALHICVRLVDLADLVQFVNGGRECATVLALILLLYQFVDLC